MNQQSGLPLAIEGSSTESGANLHQGDTSPGAAKNWRFEGSRGYYHIVSEHSGLAATGEFGRCSFVGLIDFSHFHFLIFSGRSIPS